MQWRNLCGGYVGETSLWRGNEIERWGTRERVRRGRNSRPLSALAAGLERGAKGGPAEAAAVVDGTA